MKDPLLTFISILRETSVPKLPSNPTKCTIDSSIEEFTNSIMKCAFDAGYARESCRGTAKKAKHQTHRNVLPYRWFDEECQSLKRELQNRLKDWHSYSTKRNNFFKTKRMWKTLIKRKKREAKSRWNLHLREIAHSNPRKFWKTSKRCHVEPKIPKTISKQEWRKFQIYIKRQHQVLVHKMMNQMISLIPIQTEYNLTFRMFRLLFQALPLLKPLGVTSYLQLSFKALQTAWLEYLTSLFNLVILKEYYPSSWSEAIIKPIIQIIQLITECNGKNF
jgi:hypothetical protein